MSINRNLSFLAEGASSSGVLSVTKGGTGLTTLTAGYIPYGNGTSALSSSSSLYFDGTNLGVGTTSPSSYGKLAVFGSGTVTSAVVNGSAQVFTTVQSAGGSFTQYYKDFTPSYVGGVGCYNANAGTAVSAIWFGDYQSGTGTWTERMRIDSSGNVGIGTSSPNANLHVQGAATVDGSIGFNQQLTSTTAYNSTPQSGSLVSLKYNAGGSYAGMGGWSIGKENATDGNFAGYFAIHTRANGGTVTERARIGSDGGFMVGTTTSPGAGLISDQYGNVRSLPLNSQTSAYVVAASDNGKVISITTGGVTINNSIMSAGMVVTIYNNSGSSQTITQGTGVTLQWAGQSSSTTGNRTLGLYGMATVYFLSASSAVITGSGLT